MATDAAENLDDESPSGPDDDTGETLARLAARVADDRKAADIVILDVGDVLSITGFFVIASAPNVRQVRNVADEIELAAKNELGRRPARVEGQREAQWILIDFGDVVVHVFHQETRSFYEIERLYGDVPRLPFDA